MLQDTKCLNAAQIKQIKKLCYLLLVTLLLEEQLSKMRKSLHKRGQTLNI